MRLILITLAFSQLQLLASSNPIHQELSRLKLPEGVYELRRLSDDEVRALKSNRMVTVQQDPSFTPPLQPNQRTYYEVSGAEVDYPQKFEKFEKPQPPQNRQTPKYDIRYLSQSGEVPLRSAFHSLKGPQSRIQPPQTPTYQADSTAAQDALKAQAELHAKLIAEGYQVVNEDPTTHVVSVPADGSTLSEYHHQQPQPNANVYIAPQETPVKENIQTNERYASFIPTHDQLPELQFDMRKTQPSPVSYATGNTAGVENAQIAATRQILEMINNQETQRQNFVI